jgi:hypothetical protein
VSGRARRIATLVVAGVFAVAAGPLTAQGISVVVDRTEVTLDDQIVLQVTVEGSRKAEPRLPEMPQFEILPRGQSSEVQIVNGRVTSSVHYTYLLLPLEIGTFEIGGASVEIDGETYSSRPFRLRVVEAGAEVARDRDIFVTASVSERNPYVGQQVVYTWRLFRRVRIGSAQLSPPDYSGFLVEPLGEAREYDRIVNGQQYLVHELREALFPQREGALTIPGRQLTVEVPARTSRRRSSMMDDFFGRMQTETRVLRNRSVEIDVRPLPEAPPGFSGLVGDFDVEASLSQSEMRVGESVTLEVVVSGSGNAQMIGEPTMPELPQFKAYDDQPESALERGGAELRGRRTFHRALVAQKAGEFEIEPVTLVYFDPAQGAFRTAASAPGSLVVLPAAGREDLRLTEVVAPTMGKVAVRILADDILPVEQSMRHLRAATSVAGSATMGWVLLLLPPLAWAGLAWVMRRRHRLRHDASLRRRKGAMRRASRTLGEVESAVAAGRHADAAGLASRCLREFLGDRLDVSGAALTASEADRLLRGAGASEELATEIHRLLDRLEAARYGAGTGEIDPPSLARGISGLLRRMEKELR